MRTTHRKFSTASEVKVFAENSHRIIEYSEARQSFRDLNFKSPLESHFSFNKKCFVDRTVMIQSAQHSPDLGECFIYSKRMLTTHRKFSKGFWSQSLCQKKFISEAVSISMIFCRFCMCFWRRLWLQKPVENFLCVVRIRFEYVKHFLRPGKCSALWIMTVRPTKHFLLKEKWPSSGFLKLKFLKLCQTSDYSIILC